MYEVVIGRNESDRKELGLVGTIFLGKLYVKMGSITSLSNGVYMDVARAHVVLVAGKRGTGKSYTLGTIAEEMANLPEEIAKRLSVLIVDTMGIFWTMKFPNVKDEDLLQEWKLPQKGLNVTIYTPIGKFKEYQAKNLPTDYPFAMRAAELTPEDWAGLFGVTTLDPLGVLLERTVSGLREERGLNYDLQDILDRIHSDERTDANTLYAAENRLLAAKGWGVFAKEATPLRDIVKGGQVSILDISAYDDWGVKNLVVGILCKQLMRERMDARKKEELEDVERGHSYFSTTFESANTDMPIVWILIDEAHEFLPREGKTLATDALVQILREGRQPGVCLVLATQQPGEIHKDVTTQTDIVLSHRITARRDVDALNAMMQSYVTGDIQKFLNGLPALRGAAVILDDNSERLYPVQVRPRFTWHGGEAPTAVKAKGKAAAELGL